MDVTTAMYLNVLVSVLSHLHKSGVFTLMYWYLHHLTSINQAIYLNARISVSFD